MRNHRPPTAPYRWPPSQDIIDPMLRKIIFAIALIAFLLGIMPPSLSLYCFTGEESFAAQLRGTVQWLYVTVRPAPRLAPFETVSSDVPSPFGVNTEIQWEPSIEVRDETLRLANAAGFGVIRQQFGWEDIEIHGKDDFEDRRFYPEGIDAWEKYDNIVDLAEKHDLEVLARLDNPPAWTRVMTDTIGTMAPPDNYTDYGDFVEAVVSRYAGRITYYQLWNEPNIYPEWGNQAVSPEDFTRLMCEGYRRAKAADPDVVILSGTMAPTVALDYTWGGLNDLVFLERMYQAGAADCFDVLSVQGYGLWSGPTDQRLRPTVINYPHNLLLRDVMVRHGDGAKPMWISEMAWNAVPDGIPAGFGQVTPEQKGRYAVEGYERMLREWPWIEVGGYWFLKKPTDDRAGEAMYYFRLLDPNFTPQPAYTTLAERLPTLERERPAVRSSLWFFWQQIRRFLVLGGGGVALFMLLLWTASEDSDRWDVSSQ